MDGMDIQDIPLKSLRQNIGFVTQEVVIFSDTIRNNVLFGREVFPRSPRQGLKTAEIYEKIMELDRAADSLLGEQGITLSGWTEATMSIAWAIPCGTLYIGSG
jgi:ATP-binding cassette subfamily B protein